MNKLVAALKVINQCQFYINIDLVTCTLKLVKTFDVMFEVKKERSRSNSALLDEGKAQNVETLPKL